MNERRRDVSDDGASSRGDGSTTAAQGTPVPVDTSIDRQARLAIVVLLAGPVIWALHFFVVYLVAEAGCTGAGAGLRFLDPPVPVAFTLAATALAAPACLACAWWAYRRWRAGTRTVEEGARRSAGVEDEQSTAALEFAGLLLAVLSFISVLMVGLPAIVLSPC